MTMRNVYGLRAKSACLSLISLSVFCVYQPPSYGCNEFEEREHTNAYRESRSRSDRQTNNPYEPANSSRNELNPTKQPTQSFRQRYTQEQINYFLEVAMGAEYGNSQQTIKKWEGEVKIKVIGSPTPEDLNILQTVIDEINTLAQGINLSLTTSDANMEIYFIPEYEFRRYEPNYFPLNYGFVWNWWNADSIYNSRILISTVDITQNERSHLIREELTQSLGLMRDSYRYKDSIFYQGWTDTLVYSELDKAVIEMLYHPDIRPGMNKAQVLTVLSRMNW